MIKSFASEVTEKVFFGKPLTSKERRAFGDLNIEKAQVVLVTLDELSESDLLKPEFARYRYHALRGTSQYSIDVNGRKSRWRVTFEWEDERHVNVELVKIEDTHD